MLRYASRRFLDASPGRARDGIVVAAAASRALVARRALSMDGAALQANPSGLSSRRSWVAHEPSSDFPLQNIPFGVFSCARDGRGARCASAIGEQIVDLAALARHGLLDGLPFDAKAT